MDRFIARRVGASCMCALMLLVVGNPAPTYPQAGAALTVGAVREMLVQVLAELRKAIAEGAADIKGVGNSLQANVQNVITDIDQMLGSKLQYTFDRLDATERRLVQDAELLVTQTRRAADAVRAGLTQDAAMLIGDADITAYNASYSLPCRNQEPRLVYVTPNTLDLGSSPPVVKVKGNFLNFGPAPTVTVDGAPAKIIARADLEISVAFPAQYAGGVQDVVKPAISFSGLSARQRKQGLLHFAFGCRESIVSVKQAQSFAVTVRPRITYLISGKLWASYREEKVSEALKQSFYRNTAPNCDGNIDVSQTYCIAKEYVLEDFGIVETTKNGSGSYAGPPVRSGDRCVLVPARIVGKGYRGVTLPVVGGIRDCLGNGWVGYTITIKGKRLLDKDLEPFTIEQAVSAEERSVLFTHPQAGSRLSEPRWKYQIRVQAQRGKQVIASQILSDFARSSGTGVSSDVSDGRLTVNLPAD